MTMAEWGCPALSIQPGHPIIQISCLCITILVGVSYFSKLVRQPSLKAMLPCLFVFPNQQLFRTPLLFRESAISIDTGFTCVSEGYEVTILG